MTTNETQKTVIAPVLTMLEEGYKHWEALTTQMVATETKAFDEARKAIDEGARLMKQGVDYSAKVTADWHRACHEATEKAMKSVRPAA